MRFLHPVTYAVALVFCGAAISSADDVGKSLDKQILELLQQKRDVVEERMRATQRLHEMGTLKTERLLSVKADLMDAEFQLATSKPDRVKALEEKASHLREIESLATRRFKSGSGQLQDKLMATQRRIDAEVALLREKSDQPSKVAGRKAKPAPKKSPAPTTYVVQLTRFQWNAPADPKLTANDILGKLKKLQSEGRVQSVETIRITTLGQVESMAQFSKKLAVTVGVTKLGPGREQQTKEFFEVGTQVILQLEDRDGHLIMNLEYEDSRFDGEGTDTTPPDESATTLRTSLAIKRGEPAFVAGMSGEKKSACLIVMVQP